MATTVVIQQPVVQGRKMLIGSVHGERDWDSGLFSCFNDIVSMLSACCCLPLTLCNISSRAGEFACMPWFVPGGLIALRARIRTLGGIQGSICFDCMALACFPSCAICQMDRELKAMGL